MLLPDGRVVFVPNGAKHVGLYDPSKDAWSNGKDLLPGGYIGGVLVPDGRVVFVPYTANHVGTYSVGGSHAGGAYTVSILVNATAALLLPYYNKF